MYTTLFFIVAIIFSILLLLSFTRVNESYSNYGSVVNNNLPTQSNPTILNPSSDPVPMSKCIGKYCWKTTASAYNQTATIPESIGKYGYIHNYDVLPDSKPTLDKVDASRNPILDLPGPFSGNFLLGSETKPY